jgi:3-isopropylmalate/(R)-2-methylmalate dehydratase small subunit
MVNLLILGKSMDPIKRHTGIVIPIDRANIDTDAIIPKQFLKSVKRSGFGPNLFDEWRYLDHGEPEQDNSLRPLNTDFILNQERYLGGSVLVTRENFGCGSSREHAPWALLDFGIRVILASSFADIFYGNCFKNGILPVVLEEEIIDKIFTNTFRNIGYSLSIDLECQEVKHDELLLSNFEIDDFQKHCLMNGLDHIGLTLKEKMAIETFEKEYYLKFPWLN